MGFWGWRPLAIAVFFSVWVVGCNIVSDASPRTSPTPSPRVTLTVRRLATATASPSPRASLRATILATSSPEPAAATPTPVTYIVEDGDTLGDIALAFGVDVDALRAANNDLDPRTLQPGQSLIIPLTAADATQPPTATATPPELALPDPACYETAGGALLCLGLVENALDTGLEQLEVLVQVFDAAGEVLSDGEIDVEQSLVAPGMSAPYRAYFDVDPDDVDRVSATLRRADAAADVETRFVAVEVEDTDLQMDAGQTVVTATLHNRTTDAAGPVRVIVTLEDDAGRVVGYRVSQVADSLPAGESVGLRLAIVAQTLIVDPQVVITVEARRAG